MYYIYIINLQKSIDFIIRFIEIKSRCTECNTYDHNLSIQAVTEFERFLEYDVNEIWHVLCF
jgi:hypothetical protein